MKRLLILSYHALPLDVVSSYRPKGYCDHLASFGVFPTLVTHRWEPDAAGDWKYHDDEAVVVEKNESCQIIRLPRGKNDPHKSGKAGSFIRYLRGDFETELGSSYRTFRAFLLTYLATEKFDAMLVIYSPHFQMKIALEMKRKFGIPYITDFRDLWDNQVITRSYRPGVRKWVIDGLIKFWWKRWIGNAEYFTTTGRQWRDYLETLTGRKGYVVRNGFETEFKRETGVTAAPEFVITHFGRLYPSQDHRVFLEGFKRFLQEADGEVRLEIVGSKPRYGIDVAQLLTNLPDGTWRITPYMAKSALLEYCRERTSVFWMPGFVEDNGQVPVKIYDYLMLRKNILLVPDTSPDLELLVAGSGAGAVCNTPADVCAKLTEWFAAFRDTHTVPYRGDTGVIEGYARVHQVRYFAELMHAHIG